MYERTGKERGDGRGNSVSSSLWVFDRQGRTPESLFSALLCGAIRAVAAHTSHTRFCDPQTHTDTLAPCKPCITREFALLKMNCILFPVSPASPHTHTHTIYKFNQLICDEFQGSSLSCHPFRKIEPFVGCFITPPTHLSQPMCCHYLHFCKCG